MAEEPPEVPEQPEAESDCFRDLATLCGSPGYIHAVAEIAFYDFLKNLAAHEYEGDRDAAENGVPALLKTELSTLIGLMVRGNGNNAWPGASDVSSYIAKTDLLREKLHDCMKGPLHAPLENLDRLHQRLSAEALREPIFYGPESATAFQYIALARKRYALDGDWLRRHKGFTVEHAAVAVDALLDLISDRHKATLHQCFDARIIADVQPITAFSFKSEELAARSGLQSDKVETFLEAFSIAPATNANAKFTNVSEYNEANSRPIVKAGSDTYALFNVTSLAEALYESPFHWMYQDKKYRPSATEHRGRFTEAFAADRLEGVFGKANVYRNVIIKAKGRDEVLGEIDVLVLFGDHAIIGQCKSKKLTIDARKGNDKVIRADFQASVQDAYDQGVSCAKLLASNVDFFNDAGASIEPRKPFVATYIICLVSDHYPALNFQARTFLQIEARWPAPLIFDVFALDMMTEMLSNPVYLLSYISRRVTFAGRLHFSHETSILGYHLKTNLWIEDDIALVAFDDGLADELDQAMAARRLDGGGKKTPEGILTRIPPTAVGSLLDAIAKNPRRNMISFALAALNMGEESLLKLSEGIDLMVARSANDGKLHDFTLTFDKHGITVHCSNEAPPDAMRELCSHCQRRKSRHKVKEWFGLCITPERKPRFAVVV